MKVKYFAYLREYANCKEETVTAPPTALSLLTLLSEKHGKALQVHLLTPEGTALHPDLIFLVDGRNVDFLQGADTPLKEGNVVSLFPRIAGG